MLQLTRIALKSRVVKLSSIFDRLYCKKIDPDEEADRKVKVDEDGYPEEPTTCCMSGCANCIWLDYAEKLSNYYKDGGDKAFAEINRRVTDPSIKAFLLHELRMRNKK